MSEESQLVKAPAQEVDLKLNSLSNVIGEFELERERKYHDTMSIATTQCQLEFECKQRELKVEFEAKINILNNQTTGVIG